MTLDQMKIHFFNEATELGMASEKDILRLCGYLEAKGFDGELAYSMWQSAKEEIDFMFYDLAAEFGV